MKLKSVIAILLATCLIHVYTTFATSITIYNDSDETTIFQVTLMDDTTLYDTNAVLPGQSTTFRSDKSITSVQPASKPTLKYEFYHIGADVTVRYSGNVLLDVGAYEYHTKNNPPTLTQKIYALKRKATARLATAWQSGQGMFTRMRTTWQSYYPYGKKSKLSGMAQCYIHNQLGYDIKYALHININRNQLISPSTYRILGPTNSTAFNIKDQNGYLIKIYPASNDHQKEILTVDLEQYIKNPRPNSDLHIYLQPRYMLSNKLFGWMPKWSNATYSAKWIAEK